MRNTKSITKPLFDEDEELEEIDEDLIEISPSNPKFDKIFNNDYNTGNLEFEEYGPPKVDSDYASDHMESYYNSNEYHAKMQTMEKIDAFFQTTDAGKIIGLKKKIPKQMLSKIYMSIRDAFRKGELTEVDYFVAVADYFGMSYEILYENIPAVHRESIVRELDGKYSVLKRRGLRKLF
jgi:hypothetical protein